MLITAALARRWAWLAPDGFLAVAAIVPAIALAALLLSARGFSRVWNRGDRGGRDLLATAFWLAVVALPYGAALYLMLSLPTLHDISTDLDDPPSLAEAQKFRTGAMNPIAQPDEAQKPLQRASYPLVVGRRYEVPLERVAQVVDKVLAAQGWNDVRTVRGNAVITIEALGWSPVLRFPADIAIRLMDDDVSTSVDMRSSSRYGRHDLGDNARRIVAFLEAVDAEMTASGAALAPEPAEDGVTGPEPGEGEPAEPDEAPIPEPRPVD